MASNSDLNQSNRPATGQLHLMNMSQFFDPANGLTLAGLSAAVTCALLAVNGQLAYAVVALMLSGVCDLFDGVVARTMERSDEQRQFGGHLDSIVDACSFGFAPVVLMYAAGLDGLVEMPLLILFAICVVWRLAHFDTIGLQGAGKQRYFVGLPVTYVSVFLPLAFLAGFWSEFWLRGCVGVTMVGLGILMISTFPIRKPSGVFYLLFPASGIALTVVFITFADYFVH